MDILTLGTASIMLFFNFLKRIIKYKKLLHFYYQIKQLEVITCKQLINKFTQSDRTYYGLIKGFIDSDPQQYLKSKIKNNLNLIYQKLIAKKQVIGKYFYIKKHTVLERIAPLLKLSENGVQINIVNPSRINLESVTKTQILRRYEQNNNSLNSFRNVIKLINLITQYFKRFPEINKCDIFQQKILIPKTQCVILGSFSKKNNYIYTQSPKYISKSKVALLSMLRQQIIQKKILNYLVLILLLILIIILIFRIYKKIPKNIIRNHDQLKQINSLHVKNYDCVICHQNLRNIIFKPCNHFQICSNCLKLAQHPIRCKQCNCQVNYQIEAFVC